MAKYKFKKQFEDAKISIPVIGKTITKDNLTDNDVELLRAKFEGRFDHNFEEVKQEEKPVKDEAKKITTPKKRGRKPKTAQ